MHTFSSALKFGLPEETMTEDIPTIVMHQPGLMFSMIETIPGLESVVEIYNVLQKCCSETASFLSKVCSGEAFRRTYGECIVLKHMNVTLDLCLEILGIVSGQSV